ncbi:hypothetical protein LSTR_LSTR011290 [Laodelphax striatellus]|uniref:Odorant receptor n=1 Tax=Laodelphax striatellus TaxID=195883 RepID=A0A482X4X5_LAOST|nr:hypothetical protein LSTR_LSTR011290 [Laodelphax striatellus]
MQRWYISKTDWHSVKRGLEKSGMNLLLISGLIVSPEQPWLAFNIFLIVLAAFFLTLFVVIGWVSLYFARNDLVTFVELAHANTVASGLWILVSAHYLFKFPLGYDILRMVDKGIFEYDTKLNQAEVQKIRNTERLYTNTFKNFYRISLVVIFIILAIVAPILIRIYVGEERKKIKQLNYDLPVPGLFPFYTGNFLGFSCAYLLLITEIALIFLYMSAAMPFLFFGIFEMVAQLRILKLSIMNLKSRALEKYQRGCENLSEAQLETLEHDPNYERCVKESLKENIRHHAEILRFFNLYQNLTSTIYGVLIGVSMLILGSLSLVLTKTKLFSFETVKFATFFVVELVVIFGYCLMGTFITEVSKEIPRALYNIAWFNEHEKNKKMLKTFQFISKIEIVLKGNGLFVIDLQIFVQIVKTTYSIFNIFTNMEKTDIQI